MALSDRLFNASQKAAGVLREGGLDLRLAEGYSRIDPVRLAEAAGVAVMSTPMDKLLGAFLREERAGILINSERPIGMMHMTCAHELGHFFLGHLSTSDEHIDYAASDRSDEQEANAFAYALMAPRKIVLRTMKAKGWGMSDLFKSHVVYQLSLRMGVSFKAMVWALERLNFLPTKDATRMSLVAPKSLKTEMLPEGVTMASGSDVWLLDGRDKDWIIEPRSTDRFLVNLPNHASAGYLWSAAELASEGYTLSPVLIDARKQKREQEPPLVGGGGETQYLLSTLETHRAPREAKQIRLQETRPWDSEEKAAAELALRMEFESTENGLSDGTRKQGIQEQ
jgi:Zn-dependent peptidase ImmA (M78 family)